MKGLIAALSGAVFGSGLAISGMTNPTKVISFLDVSSDWDPSLVVVMASALAVFGMGFRLLSRRSGPIAADHFHLPEQTSIDRPLIIGAILFGIGWGLFGLCPGPAIATLTIAPLISGSFVVAMFVGFWINRRFTRTAIH